MTFRQRTALNQTMTQTKVTSTWVCRDSRTTISRRRIATEVQHRATRQTPKEWQLLIELDRSYPSSHRVRCRVTMIRKTIMRATAITMHLRRTQLIWNTMMRINSLHILLPLSRCRFCRLLYRKRLSRKTTMTSVLKLCTLIKLLKLSLIWMIKPLEKSKSAITSKKPMKKKSKKNRSSLIENEFECSLKDQIYSKIW